MGELFAGIDLGGTKIAAALGTAGGEIAASGVIETRGSEGAAAALRRTASLLDNLASQCGARAAAIGMGLPGLVDIAGGTALFLPNLPGQWRDVPVARILGDEAGRPVYLLNDARMATLGEYTFGAGRRNATLLMVTIGTGIGGGLVLDGELDPVTPPRWADEAKATLSDSVHFVAPGIGHGVSAHGCAPRLIEEFLEAGTARGLDGSCIANQKRPPFFVSFAGPLP